MSGGVESGILVGCYVLGVVDVGCDEGRTSACVEVGLKISLLCLLETHAVIL